MVCIPFDKQAEEWARELPIQNNVEKGATMFVHDAAFPYLPLLWFHVALHKGADVLSSVRNDHQDVTGTAFFELHLVDALVRREDIVGYVMQFAEERVEFTRSMSRYQLL